MIRKVSFEMVSAVAYPEHYYGSSPAVRPEQVPDEHWHSQERQGDDVTDQYEGLLTLMGQGELIRNVHLYEAETPEIQWREVAR